MTANKIKVLIADDHALLRMGLSVLFDAQPDIETVGEAADGAEAVRKAKTLKPDIVVMDIMMPEANGIEATRQICAESPQTKVLCLTTSTSVNEHRQAMDAGAAGLVTKGDDNEMLLAAIRQIAAGGTYVSPESQGLMEHTKSDVQFTARQLEIMTMVAQGLRTKEIATCLGLSGESVRDHLDAAYRKLGATNRAEAVAIALRKHLLKI